MKKIAIVANSTWNIYNFRLNLIQQFQSKGYSVIIITPIDKYYSYLNKSYFTKHIPLQQLSPQSKNPFKDLLLLHELYKIYKKEQPDLILHYTIKPNIYGSIAARLTGIKCISTVTGLGYAFLNEGFYTNLVKPLYRFAFQNNNRIVFHNHDDQKLFSELKISNYQNSEVIKGSGVNTSFFRPSKISKDKGNFIFLFIGRLLYDKGILEFIHAAKHARQIIKNAEYWVVGELKAKNPSNISKKEFLQWVENGYIQYWGTTNDIRDFINKSDVIVLPSYREGMPRAILEAMAMGKPIITTDTAGCRESIDHNKNGYIVPVKDHLALAEAMIKIANLDQDQIEKMGLASRNKVLREFDEKIINQRYLDLAEEILNEKPSSTTTSKKLLR